MSGRCRSSARLVNKARRTFSGTILGPIWIEKILVSTSGWVSALSKSLKFRLWLKQTESGFFWSLLLFHGWHEGGSWKGGVLQLYWGSRHTITDQRSWLFLRCSSLPLWTDGKLSWTCVIWVMEGAPPASFLGLSSRMPIISCRLSLPASPCHPTGQSPRWCYAVASRVIWSIFIFLCI